jgi:hypothetical protein
MRENEVDVFEAEDMADIPANVTRRLAEEGKLESRRAPLIDRFMEIGINPSFAVQTAGLVSSLDTSPRACKEGG